MNFLKYDLGFRAWRCSTYHAINRFLKAAFLVLLSLFIRKNASAQYTDPLFQNDIPFGVHSHWIQPWRGYLETVQASRFLSGVGVVLNSPYPDLVCHMLSQHGVTTTRFEIGWSNVTLSNTITDPRPIAALQACHKWGLRPVILLNANQGIPCPLTKFVATLTNSAAAGATKLTFADTTGFVPGKTGISYLTSNTAAQILITAVNGKTVTLSMPLPRAVAAGQTLNMATLKYRPFSVPGSADYNATLAGWKAYVLTVGQLATKYMGAGNFDLEVWNELTFGSSFLYINDYYNPAFDSNYDETAIWSALVQATADVATANPSVFTGTLISDGFANTIPWPASSRESARVTAISKHVYPVHTTFPIQEQKNPSLNAILALESPPKFIPSYSDFFPEYFGVAIQTESFIRDISPISSNIQGAIHGRYSRPGNPCWGWVTECGYDPYYASVTDPVTALALKAKSTARFFCFYLNKGCQKVTIFATGGGDARLGIVQDNFLAYCNTNTVYPTDDTSYTSPALAVTQRITNQMKLKASRVWSSRELNVISVTDTHNLGQFQGDGTTAHPILYDRDVLTILPFQSSPNRFVIPYYVMTRKLVPALTPEPFKITLTGINPATTKVECYDPIADAYYPAGVTIAGSNVIISVNAADYPYLMIITD